MLVYRRVPFFLRPLHSEGGNKRFVCPFGVCPPKKTCLFIGLKTQKLGKNSSIANWSYFDKVSHHWRWNKLHPRSLTARPWKMFVGRRSFPFGMTYFQRRAVKLPGSMVFAHRTARMSQSMQHRQRRWWKVRKKMSGPGWPDNGDVQKCVEKQQIGNHVFSIINHSKIRWYINNQLMIQSSTTPLLKIKKI